VPAAIKQFSPIRECERMTAPIPTCVPLPIVVSCTIAIADRHVIPDRRRRVPVEMDHDVILEIRSPADPDRTDTLRSTALNQILGPRPISTSPMIAAFGATKTSSAIFGLTPLKGMITAIRSTSPVPFPTSGFAAGHPHTD
jgi:hypothetical protein